MPSWIETEEANPGCTSKAAKPRVRLTIKGVEKRWINIGEFQIGYSLIPVLPGLIRPFCRFLCKATIKSPPVI